MTANELITALRTLNIPVAYFRTKEKLTLPYLIYYGNGQDIFNADNTVWHKANNYTIEYYFDRKNEAKEDEIEQLLASKGWNYSKSEDIYIESEDIFEIIYEI